MPRDSTHHDDDHRRNPHGNRAQVVQPLANVQADDVYHRGEGQCEQRENDVEGGVVREMSPGALPHVNDVAGGEIKHGGEIGQIAGPVCPGRHESGKISERFLAPDVKPALIGIAGRQLDDGERQRDIEDQPRADPDHDRTGPGGGSGCNPAQADAGDHVEQNEVAEAHYPLGLIRSVRSQRRCRARRSGLWRRRLVRFRPLLCTDARNIGQLDGEL